jgi:uncharacterized protein YndB with AHSA1/START domain
MVQVDRTIQLQQPPEVVFDFVTTPERTPEWSSTVASASAHDEIREGATFEVEARFLGQRIAMTCEVTEHERPTRYWYRGEKPLRLIMGGTISELDDGHTELCVSIDVDPGRVFSVAGPLFKRKVRKQLEADLQRLKDVLED